MSVQLLDPLALRLAKMVVTHSGYLREESRKLGLDRYWFREADEILNPIFGSPEQAHAEVLKQARAGLSAKDEQATIGSGS